MGAGFSLVILLDVPPTDAQKEQARMDLLMWGAILFVVVLVVGGGVVWLRHWYLQRQEETPAEGFTLADLRAMRDRGDLTVNEYEVAKNKLIASFKKAERAAEERKGGTGGATEGRSDEATEG